MLMRLDVHMMKKSFSMEGGDQGRLALGQFFHNWMLSKKYTFLFLCVKAKLNYIIYKRNL